MYQKYFVKSLGEFSSHLNLNFIWFYKNLSESFPDYFESQMDERIPSISGKRQFLILMGSIQGRKNEPLSLANLPLIQKMIYCFLTMINLLFCCESGLYLISTIADERMPITTN